MAPIAFQVMARLRDSRVIASDLRALRQVAQGVLKVGRPFPLLVFRLADTHLHALLTTDEETATEFGRRVEISLQKRLQPAVRFSHVHVTPVWDQAHLRNAFHYILRQEKHHGTELDPLFEASNLPDLLGMRRLGAWTLPHVRAALPRLDRAQLEAHLPVGMADSVQDLSLLREAACAAAGTISIRGNRAELAEARAAAAELGCRWGSRAETARALGMNRSTVTRLKAAARPEWIYAVEQQARLRAAWKALQSARRKVG